MSTRFPLPDLARPRLMELFHSYTMIGGMPEVVSRYLKTTDLSELVPVYQGLLTAFMDDVGKYARNATMARLLRHAIETAPLSAGTRITFRGFGNSNYRSREMGEALRNTLVRLHTLDRPTSKVRNCPTHNQ